MEYMGLDVVVHIRLFVWSTLTDVYAQVYTFAYVYIDLLSLVRGLHTEELVCRLF